MKYAFKVEKGAHRTNSTSKKKQSKLCLLVQTENELNGYFKRDDDDDGQ